MRDHGASDCGAQRKTGYFFTGHVGSLLLPAFCLSDAFNSDLPKWCACLPGAR
jgi:hypothetical protein